MKLRLSIAFILSFLPMVAVALDAPKVDYPRLLASELAKVDYFNPGHWFFTQTKIDDENTVVAKYDPSRRGGQRWSLVSRNNKPANYDQMLDFRKDKSSADKKQRQLLQDAIDEGLPVEGGLVEMVDWNSLRLIDNSEKRVILRFQPRLERFDEDEQALLVGVMTISKTNWQLLSLEVVNRDLEGSDTDFPLESFTLKVDFTYLDGNILLQKKSTLVREPAGLFGGGMELEELRYSDYQPAS